MIDYCPVSYLIYEISCCRNRFLRNFKENGETEREREEREMGDYSSDEDNMDEVSKVTEKDKHVTLVS